MAVGRIGEYHLGTNASWDEYVERLEMFCEANKIAKEEQKRAVLLSCCGEEAYGLIVTLVKPARPTTATYEEIKTAVRKHLHPRPSELYARFLFYKRNQAAEESVADYVTALRKLAEDCGFGDVQLPMDIMMRDRFVCGLQNEAVQQRLLAEHDLTFNVAYDMAATAEATAKQQRDIRMHGRDEAKDCQGMIQATHTKQDATAEGSSCYRCNVGAVLAHHTTDGKEQPIAYASRTLGACERNYAQIDKEGLAVVFGVKRFHQYLAGREFTVITDHKPLLGLFNTDKRVPEVVSPRMLRWILCLSAYNYSLQYRRGQENSNADALSRLPAPGGEDEPHPPGDVLLLEAVECAPMQAADIAALIKKDKVLSMVKEWILSGWPSTQLDSKFAPYEHTTPHSVTGKSPAELMFGRRLRTALDRLHPDRQYVPEPQRPEIKRFHVGDAVYAKSFCPGPRRKAARVVAVRGPVSYVVQLDNGERHHRHRNELRSAWTRLEADPVSSADYHVRLPPTVRRPQQLPEQVLRRRVPFRPMQSARREQQRQHRRHANRELREPETLAKRQRREAATTEDREQEEQARRRWRQANNLVQEKATQAKRQQRQANTQLRD
ncbi:uncharacterized protein LOC142559328 [Dermacentor variabilis]|uniref:uncharacterized protein LOC142559328 n=1 Tax=Dermacentor variabilis TaxID=34621 RepID=UPI003F5AEB5A